jgi:hypothetical protein
LTVESAENTIFAAQYHGFMSNSLFGAEQGIAVGRLVFTGNHSGFSLAQQRRSNESRWWSDFRIFKDRSAA